MGDEVMSRRRNTDASSWLTHTMVGLGLILLAMMTFIGCDKLGGGSSSASRPATTPSTAPTNQPAAASTAHPPTTTAMPARPAVPSSETIAKVNDRIIGKRDVELAIEDLKGTAAALGQPWTALSAQDLPNQYDLRDLITDLVAAELRAQDAVARGLDRNTDVQYRFWNRFRTFFAQEWVGWQVERTTVTQAEIYKFYKDNQPGFREPEQIRVRQLVVASEDAAKAVLVRLLQGADFVAVAKETSVRPDAADGALVQQWVLRSADKAAFAPGNDRLRDVRDPTLEQAAFAVDKVGGTSTYVKGADGNYHIFQLVERKAGRQRPLVEVSDNIRNFLQVQKIAELSNELRGKAHVELFPERLADLKQ